MAKSKSWPELGTLRQKNEDGSKPYLHIHPSVRILIGSYNSDTESYDNYEELDLGDYRTVKCVDPLSGLDALLEKGYIDEAEHEKRVTVVEDKNIMFKLTVPPSD
ncbi:MAG: hypothetical protein COB41_00590 [Proteobacteria bacterium]|nr:MAG: hypothetical protein COB41_00590 [Pseudomonadota bacterium]